MGYTEVFPIRGEQGRAKYARENRKLLAERILVLVHVLEPHALLLLAGWNDTAYYPSLADMQSSLTIRNSSSSLFTLRTMAWVSLFVPFVAAYIWYAWRAMNRRPITREEIRGDDHQY